MSPLLLALALLAMAAAAWQAAYAWSLWQQRRVAAARALGQWQGKARQPWSRSLREGMAEAWRALSQTLESRLPADKVQALNQRLQRFPTLGPSVGLLVSRCLAFSLFGMALLLSLDLGAASAFGLGLGLLPALRLKDAEEKRRVELRQALPDAVDLLTACVQAGLGLDLALNKTGEQLSPGPLRDEWLRTLEQLRTGAERRQAFRDWEARCQSEDLGPVLRAILRSEQRGVPLSPVLQAASEQMRRLRSLRIQEQAAKAPIKMLLPLMLFFLPAVFLILFGPVFLKLSELGF